MQKEQLYQLLVNPDLLNAETVDDLKKLTEDFPWFQMAWILYAKNLKQINSPHYNSVLKNVAIRVPNRKLLFHFLNAKNEVKKVIIEQESSFSLLNELDGGQINSNGDSLIDKFLMEGAGAIRRNSMNEDLPESASRTDVLEKSTAENDEIITETLANIYFQQKKYEKALNAYRKLSLKYPEKSVYFATRIKEIEDLKNIN